MLSRRDYTAAELRERLLDREYAADEVDPVLADLRSRGIVDDRRVAAAHVRTATAIKQRGRTRIARELAARGLPRDVVDEALLQVADAGERESIRRILARKRFPTRPTQAERQRMYRHLLARGFPSATISRALGRRDGPAEDPVDDERDP
jgi:regulatory protein